MKLYFLTDTHFYNMKTCFVEVETHFRDFFFSHFFNIYYDVSYERIQGPSFSLEKNLTVTV